MSSTSERFQNRLELSNWFLQVLQVRKSSEVAGSRPTPRPGSVEDNVTHGDASSRQPSETFDGGTTAEVEA